MTLKKILLIRHPVSYKTEKHRHGGNGEPLTISGKQDAITIGNYITQEFDVKLARIYCSEVKQCLETAKIISASTNIPYTINNQIKNISMGVFDGLSNQEIATKYPEPSRQLQLWREGLLEVEDVHIPQAEKMKDFLKRISGFLEEFYKFNYIEFPVIIITRSVGVAITNLLLQSSELKGKPYTRFKFDPGSLSLFEFHRNRDAMMIYQNYTDFIGHSVEFPDE